MSSGSGKKKVAAVGSPQPLTINANPVVSQEKTGGIKLLIEKSRIVNVPSSITVTAVQNQPVLDTLNVSRITPNETKLTNGLTPQSLVTNQALVAPAAVKQKYIVKSLAPSTDPGTHDKGGVERTAMRVKVTGEDRNGQSLASGGQLLPGEHVQKPNCVVIRRPSITRQLIVPAKPETDGINGQQVLLSHVKTTVPDGISVKQHVTTTSLNNPKPAKILSTTANTFTVPIATSSFLVPARNAQSQMASKASSNRVGVTDGHAVTDQPQHQVQEHVASTTSTPVQITNNSISTVTSSGGPTPIVSVKEPIENVPTSSDSMVQENNLTEIVTDEFRENKTKLSNVKPAPNDTTGMDATSLSKVADEEVFSKPPSREIKSLQLMQSRSKILTEFITDTSNRGKLRKRTSDSAADVEPPNMGVAEPAGTTKTPSPSRKRLRKQSTVYPNAMESHGKGLATDTSYRLEDMDITSPVGRRRNPRVSAKSEYVLLQTSQGDQHDSLAGAKDGCKDFFSSFNLGFEDTETNEQPFPPNPPKPGWDRFCWRCKKSGPDLGCSKCIRSYHKYCVRYSVQDPNWSCAECKLAHTIRGDVKSMYKCLGYVLDIITMHSEWNEAFNPIDKSSMPDYDKYITRHMDLAVMKKKLDQRTYIVPEEFLADMSWIVHNMSIYPTKDKMDLLKDARSMQKKAKNEIDEMEPCQECYIHANTKSERWFTEPCSKPHLLVWAKLKGYPYWPGKLYGLRGGNQAYVRFFATHDRSWMPVKDCFIYSQQDPSPSKNLKTKLMTAFTNSVKDVEHHITRLREQFNTFNYGPFMELVDYARFEEQRRTMLPGAYLKKVKVTIKRTEGEMVAVDSSSSDEKQTTLPDNEGSIELNKNETVVQPAAKVTIVSPRKRMTRRMSRFLRNTDEDIQQSSKNVDDTQMLTASNTVANSVKTLEYSQPKDKTVDDKIDHPNGSGCNPKNLSLLLRRGSQSWETGPLSKRRKSVINKAALSNADTVSKAKPTATAGSKTDKTLNNINKDVPKVVEQEKGATTLPSAVAHSKPTKAYSNVKETLTSVQKDVTQPVVEKVSCVPPIASVEKNPPMVENLLNSLDDQHEGKGVVDITLASDSLKSSGNGGDAVDGHSLTIVRVESEAICKTANSTIATEDSCATKSTTFAAVTDANIKQEVTTGDEVNVAIVANEVPPMVKEQHQKKYASPLDAPSVPTPSVSTAHPVQPVQQSPPAALTVGAVIKAVAPTIVPSKQRARKSFPGGSIKNVTTKQAVPLTPNVLLTAPPALSSKNATVSIPKELVTPSTDVSLISSLSNDNDDVMIIEEDQPPATVPSRESNVEPRNQPPPLVPKPPVMIPPPSDNNIDLNNSMLLFDDSSNRVLDHIRIVIEDLLKDMSGKGSSLAEVAMLKLKLERQQQSWMQEKQKLQSEFEFKMAELRVSLGQEKERALNKQRQKLVGEKERAVKDAKAKQWCTKCYNEALYYCCWNTAYCSESCQQKHWIEHKTTCAQEAANNIHHSVNSNLAANLIVSPDNSAVTSRSRSSMNVSILPILGSDDTKQLNNRSPNNRVTQSEIVATSTPLQTPVRFIPGILASNVGYKTPIIQSVHGRDSMIIKVSSRSAQNGSNVAGTTNTLQQQQQQKKITARDKPIHANQQKAVSPNKGYIPKKAYETTPSPYPSTNLLTGTTTTITPMGTIPVYGEMVAGTSHVSPSAWNQLTMMQPAANRPVHLATTFSQVNRRDGTEKGHRQNSPSAISIVQQAKLVQQPTSTTFLRHQQ